MRNVKDNLYLLKRSYKPHMTITFLAPIFPHHSPLSSPLLSKLHKTQRKPKNKNKNKKKLKKGKE